MQGPGLALVLDATVLNAIMSSSLPTHAEANRQQKSGLAAASLQLRVRLYQ